MYVDRRKFVIAILLCVVSGGLELLSVGLIFPFLSLVLRPELITDNALISAVYHHLGFTSQKFFVLFCGFSVVCSVVSLNLFLLFKTLYLNSFCIGQMAKVSSCLLDAYLTFPLSYHLDKHSGSMAKDVINQSDSFTNQVLLAVTSLFSDGLILSVLLAFLIYLDPIVSIAVIGLTGSLLVAITLTTKQKITAYGKRNDEINSSRFACIISTLQAVKEIKAFGKEHEFVIRFSRIAEEMAKIYARLSTIQQIPPSLIQTVAPCAIVALAMYYVLIDENLLQVIPKLAMYAVAGFRIMPSLSKLVGALTTIRQNGVIVDNIYRLYTANRHAAPSNDKKLKAEPTDIPVIEFKDVFFRYKNGGRAVLQGVSLKIQPKTLVAVVGTSGAGKTTLVDLMLGLLTQESGEISLNGMSVADFDRSTLCKVFAYVHQSPLLMDSTIIDNVAFGVPTGQIDHARVNQAISLAHIDTYISQMRDGLLSRIGERGSKLSGGQRQRIGLARALYVDPKVLVLDESTNALDRNTEKTIIDNLVELKESRTVIAIAHSKTLVQHCDRVIMLDNGKVVEDGTYQQLIDRSSQFRKLMAHKN